MYAYANKGIMPGYFCKDSLDEPIQIISRYTAKEAFHQLLHGDPKLINPRSIVEDSPELLVALHLTGQLPIIQTDKYHSPHFSIKQNQVQANLRGGMFDKSALHFLRNHGIYIDHEINKQYTRAGSAHQLMRYV